MPIVDPPYKRQPSGYEAVYERQHARPPSPQATYALLGIMVGVFVLEYIAQAYDERLFYFVFTIYDGWWLRPWQLVMSTLSHGSLNHIFFNALFFYFFGPNIENIVGRKRFLYLFFVSGAVTGIAQVHLPGLLSMATGLDFGGGAPALGASGALMALFGVSLILMPKSKMIIFPIFVPVPLWIGGILYVLLDVLGAFNPYDGVGNFAHLAGLAIGALYGVEVKKMLRARGLRLAYG